MPMPYKNVIGEPGGLPPSMLPTIGAPVPPAVASTPPSTGTLKGPSSVPAGSTPSAAAPPTAAPATPAPAPAPAPAPGYAGVPVIIPTAPPSAGTNIITDAANALLDFGTGPLDTSQLDETLGAIQSSADLAASQAAAYGASAAFGAGSSGTAVQNYAGQQVTNALVPIEANAQTAALDFYNTGTTNQVNALTGAANAGNSLSANDLAYATAAQNAAFQSNAQLLGQQQQAFEQQLSSTELYSKMLGQLLDAGAIPTATEGANVDANQQSYNDTMNYLYQTVLPAIVSVLSGTPIVSGPGSGVGVGASGQL